MASTVMTVRIEQQLLDALRKKAHEEGRSVSKEVVRLIEQHVQTRPAAKRRRTGFGMFSQFESVDVEEIRSVRRAVTLRAARRTKPAKRR
jgi:hypothetical protein